MDANRHARTGGGETSQRARFVRVGMDDARALGAEPPSQVEEHRQVARGAHLARHRGDHRRLDPPLARVPGHVAHAALEVDGDQAGAEAVGFQPAREVHHVDGGPTHVQARGDPMDEEAVFRQSRSAFTIQRCGVLVMASGMRAVALRASTTILECSITLA